MRRAYALLAVLVMGAPGCIGNIRETTTARTATEMLLVSTAAERAVASYDAGHLRGKRVFVDDTRFESVDKAYVMSALRDHLAGQGVTLVDKKEAGEGDAPAALGAELVLELRSASLGVYDGDFVLGIPQLPVSAQGFPPVLLPPLYAFRRFSQQGWAKLEFWTYDAKSLQHVQRSGPLWGSSYYNQWWFFGIGPFDGSNDIYPEEDLPEYVPGTVHIEPAD